MALAPVVHRLAAAVRFVDAFTSRGIELPLDVRAESLPAVPGMPALPWRAVRGLNDDTYRLFVTNDTVMPVGPVAVSVTAPSRQYESFEPLVVSLPRPIIQHPPTPSRADYLVSHSLWPTRTCQLPAGETVLVGRITSGGATPIGRLRITIWADGDPMPASPYGYSDDRGEFVYRLPQLKVVTGGIISATALLQIDLSVPPSYTASVVPTQITNEAGAVLGLPFSITLGRTTTLTIALP